MTARKKKPAAPAAPSHSCGHEIWMHSKRNPGDAWRCSAEGCVCKTTTTPEVS